jgi:hypothetical protein
MFTITPVDKRDNVSTPTTSVAAALEPELAESRAGS